MHKLTFHPLGNADSTRIDLANGKKILVDYADQRNPDDETDKRIDLPEALRHDLRFARRDGYDVVVFTHLDDDHICGSSSFFYYEHSEEFQSEDRIKIIELWVPAAVLLEEDLKGDALAIQNEAWHRVKAGDGIRVFSSPGLLSEALRQHGVAPASVKQLMVNAGETVDTFSLDVDGFEVFAHSPFATRSEQGELLDRNKDAIAFQATFVADGHTTRALFFADITHDVIADIVRVTEHHGKTDSSRYDRLRWDLVKVAHHSSYTAIGPEKGTTKTEPNPEIERLFQGTDPSGAEYGQRGGRIVSTSKPIPTDDADPQPPHRQAAAYYREVTADLGGEYVVTMEHPSKARPQPLVITVDGRGALVKRTMPGGVGPIVSAPAPRAG